jgi:uncharacterized membrane protein
MTAMLEMITHLLGLAMALSFGTGTLDTAAVVGVVTLGALAVALCAHYLVSLVGRDRALRVGQTSFDRAALRVLVVQSDPNAAGRPRTRAPAPAAPVAA